MADVNTNKINPNDYISKESEMNTILIDLYKSQGKVIDMASYRDYISADADAVKADAGEYTWATETGLAYLYNWAEIQKLPKQVKNGKEVAYKPLANDEVMGIITARNDERKAKAEKKKKEEEEAKRQAAAEGREYVPTGANEYVSPIVLSMKGEAVLAQIISQKDDLIARANKTSILKVIRVHRPLAERLVDKQNPMISLPFSEKLAKSEKIFGDEANLVQDPENIANYEKIKEYLQAGDDAKLAVNTKTSKGSWAGVRVHLYTGDDLTLSRAELLDYVSKVGLAINLSDPTKPGAKVRWVKNRSKKNQQAEEVKVPQVVLTNPKAITNPANGYEVYATDVDTSKKEKKAAGSAISYQVYAFDKDGNPKYKSDNTRVVRTKRAPGYVDVFGEKQVAMYWSKAFEARSGGLTAGGSSSAKSIQNAIKAGLDAQADFLTHLDDTKGTMEGLNTKASSNPKINELIMARFAEINFGGETKATEGAESENDLL